ncbi:hypothetical protein HOY80DRAFT_1034790 [Tuber brumale]|nr:hypothetical protein HOY80DRAFT_1034790 [Tuber brumale]
MRENTNRVISTVLQASASSQRSSTLTINIDALPMRAQVQVDSFVDYDITDNDEDSDDALQHHHRLSTHPAEVLLQQQEWYNLLIIKLTEKLPSPALNRLTPAFSSQSQDAQWHSGNLRVNSSNFSLSVIASRAIQQVSSRGQPVIEDHTTFDIVNLVQKKFIEDMKKQIKHLLYENGVIQDHESRTPLEDPEAEGYLELEVSGDEESESEDNSDLEAGVEVNRLVEGPNQNY